MKVVTSIFFFCAKTQYQNLGDVIINREVLRLLEGYGDIHLDEGGMPRAYLDKLCAIKIARRYSFQFGFMAQLLLLAIKRLFNPRLPRIYYVLNPGGFTGMGADNWKAVAKQFTLIFIYMILFALGVRIIRLGASYDNLSPLKVWLERIKSNFMYANTLRDQEALHYASQIGLKKICFFPDMAFMLQPNRTQLTVHPANQAPYVVLSMRSGEKDQSYDQKLTKALQVLFADDGAVCKVFTSQVFFDINWNATLAGSLNVDGVKVVLDYNDEDQLFPIYREAVAVYSNRLHVLLFAMRQGVPAYPVVDLEKNVKITGIYQDLGLGSMLININDTDHIKIPDVPSNYRELVASYFNDKVILANDHLYSLLNR